MKKICFVTAARSEYGLMKWLMHDISSCPAFRFQLVATGGHLLKEQGLTVNQILNDGFFIDDIVNCQLDLSSKASIAASMGRMAEGFACTFSKLEPDAVVVLGDRYELLPICNTAFVMTIPIVHISGGDVTEGAIDDGIRNAVTMLATYHFPGTKDSASNIVRMRGTDKNVWAVGEPGLDALIREPLFTRAALAKSLSLDLAKKWVLMTYHPETRQSLEVNLTTVHNCLEVLKELDGFQCILTYANTDFGGSQINSLLEETAKRIPEKFVVFPSLGHERYLSLMHQVCLVVGNSSSGIVESPMLHIPTVNIGDRQKGRHLCGNVLQSERDFSEIKESVMQALCLHFSFEDATYWGDGHSSERIVEELTRNLI